MARGVPQRGHVQETAVHKVLMKIYIDMNNRPEEYLSTNSYYDSKVVGECCDDELVDVTNCHGCTSSTRATSSSGPPPGPRC